MYLWVYIYLISLVAPSFAVHLHPRHGNDEANRIARALDLHADAIFPPHLPREIDLEERGLLNGLNDLVTGLVGGVVTVLDDVGGVVATVLGANGSPSTTTIITTTLVPLPTTSAQGGDSPPAATPTSNGPGNSGATTTANNNNGQNNGNAGASSSASASGSGNSLGGGSNAPINAVYTGTFPILVTDHEGHTHTVTGSGAITLTWVTTLPNGVVSTVTEVITPTVTLDSNGNPIKPGISSARIAAIVGTLIAVFLVVLTLIVFLFFLRRRRKAMRSSSDSTRDSILSFGTSEMYHNDDQALLHPAQSTTSFRTAPAYIDGDKLDFPLPPVPSASAQQNDSNNNTTSSGRPLSMNSEGTFDLLERRSRTSLIAERNFYRKIGQYPEAGTYTPFAIPPSSEYNPSDDGHGGRFSPNNLATALERTKSVKSFHEVWRGKPVDPSTPASENPFEDPHAVAVPAPAVTLGPTSTNQQPSLWRKATFGSSKGIQPSIQGTLDGTTDSQAYTTANSSSSPKDANLTRANSAGQNLSLSPGRRTVVSLASTAEYDTATESLGHHSITSHQRLSYHSAFDRYANESENPFADHTAPVERRGSATGSSGKESGNSRLGGERITSAGWRPTTAKSTAEFSVLSSTYSNDGNRVLGSTPDPSELFYHPPSTGYTDRPSTTGSNRPLTGSDRPATAGSEFAGRISEESGHHTSEGEKTIRQAQVSYPSLPGMASRIQGGASTWRPATTR